MNPHSELDNGHAQAQANRKISYPVVLADDQVYLYMNRSTTTFTSQSGLILFTRS